MLCFILCDVLVSVCLGVLVFPILSCKMGFEGGDILIIPNTRTRVCFNCITKIIFGDIGGFSGLAGDFDGLAINFLRFLYFLLQ